ncbi:MAG: hypothetical protein RL653_3966 [Pseudomonadota bacterium]|jgi:lysophospholipase L1-like esterase
MGRQFAAFPMRPVLASLLALLLSGWFHPPPARAQELEAMPPEVDGEVDDEEGLDEADTDEAGATPAVAAPELPEPTGVARFLEASEVLRVRLAALTRAPPEGRPWRVAQLGDSHTEWGIFTGAFRQALAEGGVVSPGFVPPWERGVHPAKILFSRAWKRSTWRTHVKGGVDGPSGTSALASARGARATLELPPGLPEGTRLTAWWDAAGGGEFSLSVNGQGLPQLEVMQSGGALAQRAFSLPAGTRQVVLEVTEASAARPFRFCGFTVDRPDARLQFDGLGLGGSVHLHPLHQQRGGLETFLAQREPDLVVIWYGTNSAPERGLSPAAFEKQYDRLVQLVKGAAPGAAVLALGLPDLAMRSRACAPSKKPPKGQGTGKSAGPRRRGAPGPSPWHAGAQSHLASGRKPTAAQLRQQALLRRQRSRPKRRRTPRRRLPPVVCSPTPGAAPVSPALGDACFPSTLPTVGLLRDAERAVARSQGAAFFDLYAYMGGEGGMVRWYCQRPSLALSDFIHLSAAGYRHAAEVLVEALRTSAPPPSARTE